MPNAFFLKPLPAFEIEQHADCTAGHETEDDPKAVWTADDRHIGGVHAENRGDEREREHDD